VGWRKTKLTFERTQKAIPPLTHTTLLYGGLSKKGWDWYRLYDANPPYNCHLNSSQKMLRTTGLSQPPPGRGIKGVGLFIVNLQMHEAGKAASHLFSKKNLFRLFTLEIL